MKRITSFLILTFLISVYSIFAQGNVYLIIGSDTAIWDVMDIAKYNCNYNYNVIPDNTRNFYETMQQSYRDRFSDSYGNKIKLTWWLMCGNIFRYANNKNVPYPNVIVPYISKKYYGSLFEQFNDELTLHYHTFAWTDYDGDGIYWWNQAKKFDECKSDFNYTLAQLLIEEDIFPVSFRSGWNHMSNEWQAELDKLIPYSMHNEAPAYRLDNAEPFDNNFDWRLASKEFVPYRPSPLNYQLEGDGKGWNLRSRYVGSITQAEINTIFSKAKTKDQVVCLWGHVWDDLFPEYLLRIDSLSKAAAAANPNVKFKYCTAVEAMQLWRKSNDSTPPVATLQEISAAGGIKYKVQIDEPIFQTQPFLALKYINEFYETVEFNKTGFNEWTSIDSYDKNNLVKAGLAVTDSLGNLTKQTVNYLQDDIYVDNEDPGYTEVNGVWNTESKASWGLNSRKSSLKANDSSKVRWNFKIDSPHYYNIHIQKPKIDLASNNVSFRIYSNNQLLSTVNFTEVIPQMDWVYITTQYLTQSTNNYVEMVAFGTGQESKILSADVIKITPLVRQRWLYTSNKVIDLGFVIKKDTVKINLNLENHGIDNLTIENITSKNNLVFAKSNYPIIIPKMGKITVSAYFFSNELGKKVDTLFIKCDDQFDPVVSISFNSDVTNFFRIVDNEETSNYKEYGAWNNSVAQAFGSTSRFAYLNQSPKAYATFTTSVADKGFYDFLSIVPKTENASNKALYVIQQGNNLLDSVYVDQNYESGKWILLANCSLTNDIPVDVKIIDDGKSTSGIVLRTDAVRLSYTGSVSSSEELAELPSEFKLFQNYPNPFNPNTVISYQLPVACHVSLKVYDLLGREVTTLVDEFKNAGIHNLQFSIFNPSAGRQDSQLSSGIYFYTLNTGGYLSTKKMVLMK